jgi:hypothetical protein
MWYVLQFFTTWSCLLVLLHKYTHAWIDLHFMTFVVMVVGLYFSFINPRKFVIYTSPDRSPRSRIEYSGVQKFIVVDMLFHIGVFLYVRSIYKDLPFELSKFLMTCLLFLVYLSMVNVKRTYGVSFNEVMYVFFGTCILFSLFLLK